jgi:predicted TPR repeat methyltransferase
MRRPKFQQRGVLRILEVTGACGAVARACEAQRTLRPMPSPDEDLRTAMAAHKAERFDAAEAGYRRVLEANPNHAKALYYLGLLQFHRGDTATAITFVQRCLNFARSNGPAWNTLGGLFVAAGRKVEARDAYRRATVVAPAMAEAWYNYGICLRDEGDVEGAVSALRTSLARQPGYSQSYEALANVLYQAGRTNEAADVYGEWAARDPQSAKARHMVAAVFQRDVPARAADDYVRELFDGAARSFDANLGKLNYRAPELVVTSLLAAQAEGGAMRAASAGGTILFASVLDAGCGTGLCGPLLRSHCAQLVGVDLSSQMVERARARQCYDELVVAELSGFMRSRPGYFDAIVSADTLVYFGALEEPLRAARDALRDRGTLVFTVESLPATVSQEYRLEAHGRYSHDEQYVRSSLAASGFSVTAFAAVILREESGEPVNGAVFTARRT